MTRLFHWLFKRLNWFNKNYELHDKKHNSSCTSKNLIISSLQYFEYFRVKIRTSTTRRKWPSNKCLDYYSKPPLFMALTIFTFNFSSWTCEQEFTYIFKRLPLFKTKGTLHSQTLFPILKGLPIFVCNTKCNVLNLPRSRNLHHLQHLSINWIDFSTHW